MLVMSDEVIGMAKRILKGVQVTPETLAVDVIEEVGPGGHYLTQEHTRSHFKTETWRPRLIDRQMRRPWEASGKRTMAQRVRSRVKEILEHHEPVLLSNQVEARLQELVNQAEELHKD
jgi:trimethylamine--corrinoid protein Co-methyltransferase